MYIFMLVFQLSLNIQYRLSALNRAGRGGLQNLRSGWMDNGHYESWTWQHWTCFQKSGETLSILIVCVVHSSINLMVSLTVQGFLFLTICKDKITRGNTRNILHQFYWPKIFINGPLGQVGCLEVYLYLSSRELSVNTGLASCSQYILLSIYIFVTIINECQKIPNNGCHTVGNFNDEFASHSHFGAQKSFYYCSHCFMSILMLVNCCKQPIMLQPVNFCQCFVVLHRFHNHGEGPY